jgi:bacterioferritin (cytochrome b1)
MDMGIVSALPISLALYLSMEHKISAKYESKIKVCEMRQLTVSARCLDDMLADHGSHQ